MKKLDINELRNIIYESRYSDAYCLIKNNIELFRNNDQEDKEDIFNREILNYFKTIRNREDYLENYQAGLLNINFFNKEVAIYLLDSGIDLDVMLEPIFISTTRLLDRILCNAKDKDIIEKLLSLDKGNEEIRQYNDGTNTITSAGAYFKSGYPFEGSLEASKKLRYLHKSEITESIIDRYKKDNYCLLTEKESKYVHLFHNIILDLDNYIEDIEEKRLIMTMLLYSTDCPFIEQDSLPIIKSILGTNLYDAYKIHLEKEIAAGKKNFIKVTDYVGNLEKSEKGYALMEKATSFALNISDEDIKKYIKTKEV